MGIAASLINIAKTRGLSPTKKIRLPVHCGDDANSFANIYNVWVSYVPVIDSGNVWINADPASPNYRQMIQYTEDSEHILPADTEDLCSALLAYRPVEPETKQYVDEQLSVVVLQMTQSFDHVLNPVQDVTELKTVDVSDLDDKTTVFVEDSHVWYSWDTDSSEQEDLYKVVVPNVSTGSGRWILVQTSRLDGGEF